jgi:DNA invertase Pin-like site-specific DNA recombinase
MTRAAVYLRQSQDRNGDELAISRQRDDCVALCKAKGWTFTEYCDNSKSASSGKLRPEYQRMLADIRAGKLDAVVVWDLDRLHRRPIELEEFIGLADEKHLALATVTGECDLSTHNGRLYARIKGAVARAEMDQKSARQKRAAEQRAEQGTQWWSTRPFGFTLLEGSPVLDPAEAQAIKDAYSAVLGGASLYAITQDWNRRGLLTPRGNPWRGSQVRQVLLSPRNAGLRAFRGELLKVKEEPVRGNWPSIVPQETWRAVVDKLADPSRRSGKSRARRHLLSNLAQCSLCGSGLGSGVNSRGALIYSCKSCNRVSRNGAWLDAVAVEAVVGRLSRPDAAELVQPEERDDLAEVHEKARALRARLDSLAVEFADGDLTPSQLKTATKRITEQLAQAEQTITDSQATHVFDGVIGAEDVGAAFAGLSLDRKRAVISSLLTLTVKPSGRCGRTFRKEDVDLVLHAANC